MSPSTCNSGIVHNHAAHHCAASDAQTDSRKHYPRTPPTSSASILTSRYQLCAATQRAEDCETDSAEHAAALPATRPSADSPAYIPSIVPSASLPEDHGAANEKRQTRHVRLRLVAAPLRRHAIYQASP